MQIIAIVLAVVAAANAGYLAAPTTLVRTPQFDSAVIKSDRLGGNFAYSSVEGHAYAAVTPVVQKVVAPVGVSYTATPYATPIAAPVVAAPYAPAAYPYAAAAYPHAGYSYAAGAYPYAAGAYPYAAGAYPYGYGYAK